MNFSKLRTLIQLLFLIATLIGLFNGLSILWIILFAFLIGPVFCGWICPFGTLQDFMTQLRKKLGIKSIKLHSHNTLKYLRYLLFALMFLNIGDFLFTVFTYDPRLGFQQLLQYRDLNILNGIVLLIFLFAALFIDRFFCKYLCIEGAKHSILSSGRLLKIERTDACIDCKKCDKACPMGVTLTKEILVKDIECITCLNCIDHCPVKGAIHLKANFLWKQVILSLLIAGILLTPYIKMHFEESATVFTEPVEITELVRQAETLDRPDNVAEIIETDSVEIEVKDTTPTLSTEVEAEPTPETEPTPEPEPAQPVIKTETLEGSAKGFKGTITVEVKKTGDTIKSITVLSHRDDRKWYNRAIVVLQDIIDAQSTDVDTISGATYTSHGLINAVNDALDLPQRDW